MLSRNTKFNDTLSNQLMVSFLKTSDN